MKARIKATEEELEVHLVDKQARYIGSDGVTYWEEDLDFGIEDNTPDYWTKLEHQYAGMAMQAYIIVSHISQFSFGEGDNDMRDCKNMAHALVEKLKEKEERK